MRILVVSQYFWPENFRVNELVSELVTRGHHVTVLTGEPNYPSGRVFPEYRKSPNDYKEYCGAPVVRVPMIPRGQSRIKLAFNYLSFVLSGSIFGAWKLRESRFDTVFVFLNSPITAALPALLIGRLKKAPVAIWILDLWPDTLEAVGVIHSRFVLRCLGYLVSFIYRRSARIFVQSKAFLSSVVQYGGDAACVRYFPAWAEQVFDEAPGAPVVASEVSSLDGEFKILFAGNIGDAQDFPSILTAIQALRDRTDIRWIIVGDGRAKSSFEREIKERGLDRNVVMLGQHPIECMPAFFRAADALLVSLKPASIFSMTIPGKVQSYLAAGVPVLGMLDGEGARVIEEAGAGLVCRAGDGPALARQALRLSEMAASERVAMGARGRAYAAREFNRAHLIDRLEQALGEIVQSRQAERAHWQ